MRYLNNYFFKVFFILVVCSSCKSTYLTEPFVRTKIPPKPDYANENNWAVLPSNYTAKLEKITSSFPQELQADVFYVYPTLITNKKDIRWNVAISDTEQQDKVLNKAVHFQASAWATSGKVYVPYYRQAHLRSYRMLENGGIEALMLAYSDVKAAFELYIKNTIKEDLLL